MKPREVDGAEEGTGQLSTSEQAALRAWYEGVSSREAVEAYLPARRGAGQSARAVIGALRTRLASHAIACQRRDLAASFTGPVKRGPLAAKAASVAMETLRKVAQPLPLVTDSVAQWLSARSARALNAAGIRTLADLTVRVPRRRQWWVAIPGLGARGAKQIEAFFADHAELTARAQALVMARPQGVRPWEHLVVPTDVDGSQGTFRAPRSSCSLRADNDYAAVQAWLSLRESASTQRAYRKEAERLILWAIVERGLALSSLTTEDAVAYRSFLRHPAPRTRWVGPSMPRSTPEWRPFAGGLSSRSVSYALSVLRAMFRWLVEHRYVLANPFAGIKVRGGERTQPLDTSRAFSEAEWRLVRTVADGLEWSYEWSKPAAQRLRFLVDFAYATGLRVSELVSVTLRSIEVDAHGDHWLSVIGKGGREGKVVLPLSAKAALERYLVQRGVPVTPALQDLRTPLLGTLDGEGAISTSRLTAVLKRFFATVAKVIGDDQPTLTEKLKRASPHWMRHTHATHALQRGADLTAVRDNLRHASVTTTSIYLHSDDARRARQMEQAFSSR